MKNSALVFMLILAVANIGLAQKQPEQKELLNSYIVLFKDSAESKAYLFPKDEEADKKEVERLNKTLQSDPTSATDFYRRARIYERLGEYKKALADYRQAIDLNPNDYQAINNRGVIYAKTGCPECSIGHFTDVLRINPKQYSSYYNFGLALLNQGIAEKNNGFFKSGVSMLSLYIRNEPGNINSYKLRAFAYRKLGKTAEAKADEKMVKTLAKQKGDYENLHKQK